MSDHNPEAPAAGVSVVTVRLLATALLLVALLAPWPSQAMSPLPELEASWSVAEAPVGEWTRLTAHAKVRQPMTVTLETSPFVAVRENRSIDLSEGSHDVTWHVRATEAGFWSAGLNGSWSSACCIWVRQLDGLPYAAGDRLDVIATAPDAKGDFRLAFGNGSVRAWYEPAAWMDGHVEVYVREGFGNLGKPADEVFVDAPGATRTVGVSVVAKTHGPGGDLLVDDDCFNVHLAPEPRAWTCIATAAPSTAVPGPGPIAPLALVALAAAVSSRRLHQGRRRD